MSFTTDKIRNLAIIGHGGTGKTTLVEHALFGAGAIARAETVDSGKTVSDYTDEEIHQKLSIHTSLSHAPWNDCKINLLDTPGSSDFVGEVVAALRATESAVVAIAARAGIQIETIKLWRRLNVASTPRMVFVNKMDEERADFFALLENLRERFALPFVAVSVPVGAGGDFRGVIDLIEMKFYPAGGTAVEKAEDIPADLAAFAKTHHEALIEVAAVGDDELMEKYLLEEDLTVDEAKRGLMEGLRENKLVPVLCGSALAQSGIAALLDFLANAAPSPVGAVETALLVKDGEQTEVPAPVDADGAFAGFSFKTSIDQFSGKLSFVKVVTGTLKPDLELYNVRESKKDRFSRVYTAQGKKLEETDALVAGDIGILAKLATAHTNDSLCTAENIITFQPLQLPQPVYSVAIEAGSKKDEDKLAQQLQRAIEEDKTLTLEFNAETKQTVFSGMGELHLNMILDRIRENQKIEITTHVPKVAYRETITGKAESTYRHKKQSGGHGQFGEVSIKIEALERGQYYHFENQIKGMAVSKGYVPGIEKGLHEAMEHGVLAGYPVVDVGVGLVDGKEHPVDSSEMAFKLASRGALRDAMAKAKPALLEPVMKLSVFIEDQYLGDVLSDLSGKRGRVLGQEQLGGGIVMVEAEVPQSELLRYAIDLRSITSGTGGFELAFDHYSPISGKIADEVIKASEYTRSEED